jgi:hypothetical protein
MMTRILLASLFFGTYAQCEAQQLTAGAGGSSTMSGTTITWSVGETIVGNASQSTVGFQQGGNSVVIGIEEIEPIDLNAYPNPARDFVILEMKRDYNHEFELTVYNLSGSIVIQKLFTARTQRIELDISTLSSGPHEIIITSPRTGVATLRFIKL